MIGPALALWQFFTGSFVGRALGAALVCALVLSATYAKGRYDDLMVLVRAPASIGAEPEPPRAIPVPSTA